MGAEELLSDTASVHPAIGHVSCSRSRAARVQELLNILPPTANDGLDRLMNADAGGCKNSAFIYNYYG